MEKRPGELTRSTLTPAEQLAGLDLPGGWRVLDRVERPENATGGNFSVGYLARGPRGEKAYLKALDFTRVFCAAGQTTTLLEAQTKAFNFERDLCFRCRDERLSHVVTIVGHGEVPLGHERLGNTIPVPYLLFELGNRDVRHVILTSRRFDHAWALRSLHHVANGLRQLHTHDVAHQDLKPSNVVVFPNRVHKVADLGCASVRGTSAPRDVFKIAGDKTYAPLELLYEHLDPDWSRRRLGCDLYMLGSLVVFYFTATPLTSLVVEEMETSHRPGQWSGTYESVLAYVRDAFDRAVTQFASRLPHALADDLTEAVRQLCEPDPCLRGHPAERGRPTQYSLERYVSLFDLLARKVELGLIVVT